MFKKGDQRFEGLTAERAVRAAIADPTCIMVNRNQGAGTRILIDRLLDGARPEGYWNQPRSHNAVAASVTQGRADWGMTIAPVAKASNLGFIPFAEEHYDFAVVAARKCRPAVGHSLKHSPRTKPAQHLRTRVSGRRERFDALVRVRRDLSPSETGTILLIKRRESFVKGRVMKGLAACACDCSCSNTEQLDGAAAPKSSFQ